MSYGLAVAADAQLDWEILDFELQEAVLDELEHLAGRAADSPLLFEVRLRLRLPMGEEVRHLSVDVVIGHASRVIAIVGVSKYGFPGDV